MRFTAIIVGLFCFVTSVANAATLTQLTTGSSYHFEPRFSPTQDVIIYAGGDLYTIPSSGGGSSLFLNTGMSNYSPCYFPDGVKVVFNGQGPGELFVYDGVSSFTQITFNGARNDDPYVSPDGQWIYFVHDKFGASVIMRIHPDGTGQQTVVTVGQPNSPSVSPDGTTLYYSANSSGSYQIWRANTDGTNSAQVTPEDGHHRYCAVQSPTAPLLAYSGEGGGPLPVDRYGIFTCGLNGQQDTNQLVPLMPGTHPSWSRNGDMITFQGVVGGEYHVFLLTNLELPVPARTTSWGQLKAHYR